MKKWSLLFALVLFVLGACQKYKAHYSLNCQFPPFFANGSLVVTDYRGHVLGVEPILTGQSNFQGEFEISDKDAPDSFDVHLIYTSNSAHNTYWVYSQLGVYNASSLFINPLPAIDNALFVPHNIQIRGVQSLESLKIPESIAFYSFAHDPMGEVVNIVLYPEEAEGTVLRIKANQAAKYSALYIPDDVLAASDTLVFDLASFEAEGQLSTLVFENGPFPDILKIDAVSPDFRHHTPLFYQNGDFSSLEATFYRPTGIPASWQYRVAGRQAGIAFDRIYSPSQSLFVKAFDKSVAFKRETGTQFSLMPHGNIEVIKLTTTLANPQDTESKLFWQVTGKPASFAAYEIPDFGELLPNWAEPEALFRSGFIRASSFDKYDYVQIQAGFPFTLNEPFAVAKSGYEELWDIF